MICELFLKTFVFPSTQLSSCGWRRGLTDQNQEVIELLHQHNVKMLMLKSSCLCFGFMPLLYGIVSFCSLAGLQGRDTETLFFSTVLPSVLFAVSINDWFLFVWLQLSPIFTRIGQWCWWCWMFIFSFPHPISLSCISVCWHGDPPDSCTFDQMLGSREWAS